MASPGIEFRGGATVARLQRKGQHWLALDASGRPLADEGVVVLAGAGAGNQQATAMAELLHGAGALAWPGQRTRGQISWFLHEGPALPWPVAGGGYALHLPATADLLCGATTQADDNDARVREADHAFNLARLKALTGLTRAAGSPLHGRVAWRERVADRLPVVGAAVDALALHGLLGAEVASAKDSALRHPSLPPLPLLPPLPPLSRLPRLPGLFVLGAMAGRGFTWGPLAGEVLASWVDQTPQPLEADLLDALDPARFWLRQARRRTSAPQA
jgi:tRNA 5-methylaminomethyl-2-thiouridine biosynthesis bifunctional protein